jgi:hypothetical protein
MLRKLPELAIVVKLNAEPGRISVGIKTIKSVTQVRADLVPTLFVGSHVAACRLAPSFVRLGHDGASARLLPQRTGSVPSRPHPGLTTGEVDVSLS